MPKRLVVVVPSVMRRLEDWSTLIERVHGLDGYGADVADWFLLDHRATLSTRRSATSLAATVAAEIHQRVQSRGPFEDVVLVGHSLGGMLVRSAYVQARQAAADERNPQWPWLVSADRAVRQPQPRHGGQPAPAVVAPAGVLVRAGAAVGSRVPAARPAARLGVRQLAADRLDPDHVVGSRGAARRAAPRHRGRPGDGAGEHRHRDLPHRTDGVAAGRHPRRPRAPWSRRRTPTAGSP